MELEDPAPKTLNKPSKVESKVVQETNPPNEDQRFIDGLKYCEEAVN